MLCECSWSTGQVSPGRAQPGRALAGQGPGAAGQSAASPRLRQMGTWTHGTGLRGSSRKRSASDMQKGSSVPVRHCGGTLAQPARHSTRVGQGSVCPAWAWQGWTCVCVCVHLHCATGACAAGCACTCVHRQAVPLESMFVYQHPTLGECVPLQPQLPHAPEELREQGWSPHTAADPAEPESTQCPSCLSPLVTPGYAVPWDVQGLLGHAAHCMQCPRDGQCHQDVQCPRDAAAAVPGAPMIYRCRPR